MKRNTLVILLLLQVHLLSACHYKNFDRDSSSVVHEIRTVDHFTGISASTGVDVYISQGNTEHVEVVSSQKSIKNIRTEVENGILKIYYKHKEGFRLFSIQINNKMKVYVTAKELNNINASSGSDIFGQTKFNATNLSLSASSGANISMDITCKNLNCEVSSGSDAQLKGTATNFIGSASSGADVKAIGLVTDSSTLDASSGSDIKITVNKSLKATASSGGDITYNGNPGVITKDKSSGGDIHQN